MKVYKILKLPEEINLIEMINGRRRGRETS
jgi:hypothetical protein